MFSLPYLWTFLFGAYFAYETKHYHEHFTGASPLIHTLLGVIGSLGLAAEIVFLILGFWFMPHWWYPIVFYVLSIITHWAPLFERIVGLIGIVATPILMFLSYYYLFC